MAILPLIARLAGSGAIIAKKKFPRLPQHMFKPPPGFKKPKTQDFKADMERLGEEIAEEFMDVIVANIRLNKYGFRLAKATLEKKRRKGQPSTPLIADGDLVDAIYREGTKVSVQDTPRKDSELTNLELAIVHEYGRLDRSIPARPVWRKTYRDFRPQAKKRMDDFFKTHKFKGNT